MIQHLQFPADAVAVAVAPSAATHAQRNHAFIQAMTHCLWQARSGDGASVLLPGNPTDWTFGYIVETGMAPSDVLFHSADLVLHHLPTREALQVRGERVCGGGGG